MKSSASRTSGVSSTALTPSMGTHFQFTDQAKYLGVTIDTKLSWGHHTNAMTKKANNTIAFLRRNLSSCPRQIRATCYKSLVRPQLEYASTVWDHTNKTTLTQSRLFSAEPHGSSLETIDRKSSETAMLRNLQLESLQERRLRARAVMMFRVMSNLNDLSSGPLHPSGTATRGHTQRYIQPFCHIKSYQDSFYPCRHCHLELTASGCDQR